MAGENGAVVVGELKGTRGLLKSPVFSTYSIFAS